LPLFHLDLGLTFTRPPPQQPGIILLKEGTDDSQGLPQLISNINACEAIASVVATTLGPCGMDKLIHAGRGVTISNDGATVIKQLDIVHAAAKTMVEIARSQDEEVGDGTTSVVVLAGELLKECKPMLEDGVHPRVIIRGYRTAAALARNKIKELAVDISGKDGAYAVLPFFFFFLKPQYKCLL